jgi:DNA-binding NarL/FixJ family response regulator
MRVAPPVILSAEQREELGKLSRGRRTAVRVVERSRIILLCAEGKQNREIAEILGTTRRTVGFWAPPLCPEGDRGH